MGARQLPGRRAKRVGVCFASNTDLELWTEEVEQGVIDNMIVFQKPFPGPARTELESQLQRAVKVSAKHKHVKRKLYQLARPLSLEGVSQMVYILPERLLALVRPAFDLVLRRIRSLKRCVQACGCKIETPRYACNLAPGCISSEPTFAGLRKNKKKKTRGPKKSCPRKKGF